MHVETEETVLIKLTVDEALELSEFLEGCCLDENSVAAVLTDLLGAVI